MESDSQLSSVTFSLFSSCSFRAPFSGLCSTLLVVDGLYQQHSWTVKLGKRELLVNLICTWRFVEYLVDNSCNNRIIYSS